jgi:hypothetical protein
VDAKTWKSAHLTQTQSDGSVFEIELLRPEWWLSKQGFRVNNSVTLHMPEIGAFGAFHVDGIESLSADSLSPLQPGSHYVIGRFVHHNAEVLDLTFEGESEPLGVTATHPIWNVTRNAWVSAGDFTIGEEAQTSSGTAKLLQMATRPGRHTVYNLEVHQAHTYRVGDSGVLVHNAPCGKPSSPGKMQREVERGQAPKQVTRVDKAHDAKTGQPHVHLKDGTAINRNGSPHDAGNGIPNPYRDTIDWLRTHNWL